MVTGINTGKHVRREKEKQMLNPVRVSKYAVGLVVAGGVIWVAAGILYGGMIASCFPSCGSAVLASGSTAGYPPDAVRNLAWDVTYANLYVAAIGLLGIFIGLKAFRRGERWAWYSILVLALTGIMTSLFDYLSWGGWYTFFFFGLLPLLGLVLSAKSFFFLPENKQEVARERHMHT
jgi:hypothetical protein